MPGFMPGIHVFLAELEKKQDVDGRTKSGHDILHSPRRHAQRAIEADDLAIEIAVVDAMQDQRGELARFSQTLGKRHRGAE